MKYAVVLSLFFVACGDKDEQTPPSGETCDTAQAATYDTNIKPLLDKYCVPCHVDNAPCAKGAPPWGAAATFGTYIKTHPALNNGNAATDPRERIKVGNMPPANRCDGIPDVTEVDKCLFEAWFEGGTK